MLYQTHVLVHLKNIRHNIEQIREISGPERKIMIAVKANAYGHGAVQVSQMAEKTGVDWLCVSTVPEGAELRHSGISLPILKLTPAFPEEMKAAVENDLTFTVCDKENCRQLNEIGMSLGKRINVHLKIDTGMGRLGVSPDDALPLAAMIAGEFKHLFLEGIYTHLPASDEANKTFTERQISNFCKIVRRIENSISSRIPLVHCANSAAILAHSESLFNMVRPGLMIYGLFPSAEVPHRVPLKPGLSFLSKVMFLKKVKKGSSISYGRTWIAPEDCWIATIPAGYADGFNRQFSNKGRVLINGQYYPVVGRVCMDQIMVNLGPRTPIRVGDDVVFIGKSQNEEITVYEWAESLQTITYEVIAQINFRVVRIFEPF